ncbi:MAG: hypothetical protein MR332_03480 [Fusicatenibacter sp.]|nr:hypothetical protein [Fusicatenibacter sp.]
MTKEKKIKKWKPVLFTCMIGLLFLTGCQKKEETLPAADSAPESGQSLPESESGELDPAAESGEAQEEMTDFMEDRIPVGDMGNVWYVPVKEIETMSDPRIYLYQNSLLFAGINVTEQECWMDLCLISLENGAILGKNRFSCSGAARVQIGVEGIAVCDSASGMIRILEADLQQAKIYQLEQDAADWYLSPDMETLYLVWPDQGIFARNLESGEESVVLEQSARVSVLGETSLNVIFSYVDRQDQKTKYGCLLKDGGMIEKLPIKGVMGRSYHSGNVWLLEEGNHPGWYDIVELDQIRRADCSKAWATRLTSRNQLLVTDAFGRTLNLYEPDGTYVSCCVLPGDDRSVIGEDLIWSGYRNGYFFTDNQEGSCKLMFWDPEIAVPGENLSFAEEETNPEKNEMTLQELYEQAERLSEQFGMDIRIAEQCELDYSHLDAYVLCDEGLLSDSLDVLERALSSYPNGFMKQLMYGSISTIRMEVVGGLQPKEGAGLGTSTMAFAQDLGDSYLIAVDGSFLSETTIYHEITHMIDKRLAWDASLNSDALFDENTWLELQPEGFDYAYSYEELPERVKKYYASGYFAENYACTYPTEDRATMMELAMTGASYEFELNPGLRPKLEYYSQCIRECFDTANWPETTVWEQML